MSQFKASEFIKFAKSHVNDGYVYGTIGQTYTQTLAKQKDKQYGAKMGANYYFGRCSKWFGKWVCDCVGLFKAYIFKTLGVSYSASWDVSADGAYLNWCTTKGTDISKMPKQPGIAVFSSGHIGLYIGNGKVIEARGADYGVVITDLKARPWTKWGRLKWLDYDLPMDGQAVSEPTPIMPSMPDVGVIIEDENTGEVTGGTVNVRKGPSTAHDIVRVAKRGEILPILGKKDGWYQVGDDPDAWISEKYLRITTTTGIVTGNSVNLRSGPGTTYKVLGTVNKGATIPLLQSKDGWWETAPGSWISGQYVKVN